MPRNGTGTMVLPAGQPVVSGTTISSATFNTLTNDIANALTTSLASDGQTTPSANLPMGGHRLVGLGAGVSLGDSLRFEQLFSQGAPVVLASAATVDIGGQNSVAIEITGTTAITSLGTNYNGPRYLRFTGALILTHNAGTLNLPGAANITTTAGDVAIAYPNSAGTGWNVIIYAYNSVVVSPRATRIDVASVAGTVDLTANAPNTDDIRITGALAITAFTLTAGRVVRVTAGGAFTLTNNANIVTNSGANLVAAAGDTFMLRATAANVVEVMGYVPYATTGSFGRVIIGTASQINSAISQYVPDCAAVNAASLGYGTQRDMTASRAFGTNYTNTYGRPIWVHAQAIVSSGTVPLTAITGGNTYSGSASTGTNTSAVDFLVRPGDTYSVPGTGMSSLSKWFELG